MKNTFLITLSLVLALAGCSSENSITGGYGDHVLSGQIFAAGNLAGASEVAAQAVSAQGAPVKGVEVRAKGTGASSTSDANGRFALSGLPAAVELSFTRSDGINASAQVNVAASPVVIVELSQNSAHVIPASQSKREIEGTIKEVDSDSITVNDARTHGEVTATIDQNTIIRHGNTMLTAEDLEEGDRVHVRALIEADGSYTALEIMLQNSGDNGGPAIAQLEGLIEAITCPNGSDGEITVDDASRGSTDATITADTKIRRGNSTIPCSQLKENDRVHVKAQDNGDGTFTALEIRLQNPA